MRYAMDFIRDSRHFTIQHRSNGIIRYHVTAFFTSRLLAERSEMIASSTDAFLRREDVLAPS